MTALDRLVRKEVSLGAIRELTPPEQHIGLAQIAPFHNVATDDVIFDYIKGGLQDGLAPARAEDAEAELAQKDDLLYGSGRASVIDWSLKTKYTASDVTRYREDLRVKQLLEGANVSLDLNYNGSAAAEFQAKVARDDKARKRRLDNRLEWMIWQAMQTSKIIYNDGRIKFSVDYKRPADQQDVAPASGLWDIASNADFDPIGDILKERKRIFDRTGVYPTRGWMSEDVVNELWKSKFFLAALGMPILGGTPNVPLNPDYLGLAGYNPEGALAVLERATKIKFTIFDGVYRTRPIGSQTYTNNRFMANNIVILAPSEGDLGEIDDTEVGFAKTLTSPHPEGNWSAGWYEWEDESKDPWLHVRGSGIKAFPVFPYLEYTSVLKVRA